MAPYAEAGLWGRCSGHRVVQTDDSRDDRESNGAEGTSREASFLGVPSAKGSILGASI